MPRILHVHFREKHNVGDAAVVRAVRELVEAAVGRVAWSSMLMRALRQAPTQRLLRFIDSHDLVIVGGGGFCSKFALPLSDALVEKIRPPLVLFGVGHNRHFGDPGLDEDQQRSLALIAHKAALCGVRDRSTRDLLGGLGVQAALTGDPALFLTPRRPWRLPPRRTPAVGVNVACHGWGQQDELFDHALAVCREVMTRLDAACSPQLLYMVHTDSEIATAKVLRRQFPSLAICRYPAAKLAYVYGRLDLALSMMLHASILAYAAGTPVVNIAYDEKNRAFLEDIGHPERCFPVAQANADAVFAACEAALAAGAPREAGAARALYGAALDAFMARLADLTRAT